MGQRASPGYRGPTATPRGHRRNCGRRVGERRAPGSCLSLGRKFNFHDFRFQGFVEGGIRCEVQVPGTRNGRMYFSRGPCFHAPGSGSPKLKIRMKVVQAEVKAQVSAAVATLAEDPYSVPCTHMMACNSSTRGSHASSDLHVHTGTHTYNEYF